MRDEKGRFVKGHSGNAKGRRKRQTEDKYLRALQKCATPKEWNAICKQAVKDAKKGDRSARQWLSDYLLGKPQQFIDLTSGGDKLPGAIIYLPKIDDLETEQGAAGEVSS